MKNHLSGKSADDQPVEQLVRVALASPGDVLEERRTFLQAVEEINETLRDMDQHARLVAVAWEYTHPDAGPPQDVIFDQLSFKDCDIFIGAFWKRFGTPPGDARPDDGQPYLSGTEKEIEEAFETRRTNKTGRPIIMLYRKMDALPASMSDDTLLKSCVVAVTVICAR